MSAEVSSPGPVFTRVRLVGSPEEVGRLTALLGGAAEVIFDSPSEPDARGEIERVVEVVGHPVPRPVAPEHGAQVTLQVVLEADGVAFAGREEKAAAREVEEAVTRSLQSLPHIRRASSRVVSLWGLPAAPE
ncbi:hypothetical protein [Streptomyces sp. NWU49]|uniref:hypothetical protein n=1 Tax=Streptomyces sp. NWU49 TaxID=2201153 RepID=UPI0011B77424|nr:hypothetical protein [Streptomyces sp. NWU49]